MRNFNNGFSNNLGLFELAQKSKVQRNVIWFIILATIVTFIVPIPIEVLNVVINETVYDLPSYIDDLVFSLILGFGITALVIFAIVKYSEKRLVADLGFFKQKWLQKFAIGFGYGVLLMLVIVLLIYFLGGYTIEWNYKNEGLSKFPVILIMLLGWIVQGTTEEIITRGWMLPLIGRKYNVPFAIVITSLFFTALHLLNSNLSVIPLIDLFMYGVFAALVVIKTKNLWVISGIHAAWNWMQGNILGIQVSGESVPGGSLIKLIPQKEASTLISGGNFGVEGSLICTLVFLTLSIMLIVSLLKEKTE